MPQAHYQPICSQNEPCGGCGDPPCCDEVCQKVSRQLKLRHFYFFIIFYPRDVKILLEFNFVFLRPLQPRPNQTGNAWKKNCLWNLELTHRIVADAQKKFLVVLVQTTASYAKHVAVASFLASFIRRPQLQHEDIQLRGILQGMSQATENPPDGPSYYVQEVLLFVFHTPN